MDVTKLFVATAADRLGSMHAQQSLDLAFAQHLTLCLKLIRILHANAQIGSIEQLLNQPEEYGMRGPGAEASETSTCQWRVD